MKKYRFAYPRSAFVIFGLIIAAGVVSILFSVLRLAEVGKYASSLPALDVVTIIAFAIFYALIGYNLFGSYYAFEESDFLVAQLFFRKRIAGELLVKFVIDEASGVTALYYFDPATPDTLSFVTVNLRRRDVAAFTAELREFKPDVLIEFNPTPRDRNQAK